MNTNILKKLSKKIVFRQNVRDDIIEYIVERKSLDTGEWEVIGKSLRIERALSKKHNAWYAELSRLNYTSKILNRRKTGKSAFFHKRRKRRSPNYKNL